MASLIRSSARISRLRLSSVAAVPPRRLAHSSYGNEQSGHEQGLNEKNPKKHLEHPGPEAPATKGSNASSSSSSNSSSSSSQPSSSTSNDAKPTIQTPKSAAEDHDPEVKKHNEEMANRADRSANQLSEDDNKVDKKFWKGDVGDMKGQK